MKTTDAIKQLSTLSIFTSCSRRELRTVDSLATWIRVDAGRVLCREGDVGREFFVIVDGSATVTARGRTLGRLARGEAFGELALVGRQPRRATVIAAASTEVLVFNRAEFNSLLDRVPRVRQELLGVTSSRLREAYVREPLKPLAVTRRLSAAEG